MNDKLSEFKKELHDLLAKYDAYIHAACSACSDMYGIYDPHMKVEFKGNFTKQVPAGTFRMCDGWGINREGLE
jgi:hypothetical protein